MSNLSNQQDSPADSNETVSKEKKERVLLTTTQVQSVVRAATAPLLSVISFVLIVGLAVTGLAAMGVSAVVWLFERSGIFCGFGLLTGGLFLAASTALFLGKISRAERAMYARRRAA